MYVGMMHETSGKAAVGGSMAGPSIPGAGSLSTATRARSKPPPDRQRRHVGGLPAGADESRPRLPAGSGRRNGSQDRVTPLPGATLDVGPGRSPPGVDTRRAPGVDTPGY